MEEDLKLIGARIRELREISDFSTKDLADYLNVDQKTYEAYEATGKDIPISALYQIANKFKVDFAELLTGTNPHLVDYCIVKKDHRTSVERFPGYNFFSLAKGFKNKMMEPLLVTVDPEEGDPALVTHKGQEFNMVLNGSIEVIYDKKRLVLEEGDCIYFNPTHPHGQRALNNKPATFLTVIAELGVN